MIRTAANVHDSKVLEEEEEEEAVGTPSLRSASPAADLANVRPEKLHADKGYDYPRCREALRRRGIKARIARRGIESSQRLGRHRWVVERGFSWLYRVLSPDPAGASGDPPGRPPKRVAGAVRVGGAAHG